MKDKRGWGIIYEDGRSTSYGWVSVEDAPIHDPRYCKKPSDITYKGDPHLSEINKGELVKVVRITTVKIEKD